MPGAGACPADVDCQGSWSTCTAACEKSADRIWTESVAKSGKGKDCPAAEDCMPGAGACPACEDVEPPMWYKNNSCAKQKAAGKCPKRVQENSKYCKKTCGMCGSVTQPPTSACYDVQPPEWWNNNTCAKQQSAGKCGKRKEKNSMYCRKTCGMC